MHQDSVSREFFATIGRLTLYMGSLAILGVGATTFFQAASSVAVVAPSPPQGWVSVERPHPAFTLAMPELAGNVFNYAVLRRPADGTRKDILSWGTPAAPGAFVMVEIDRPGAAAERFMDAPSEIAARIVGVPVTDDVKPAGQINSKFGAVRLVDFAIAPSGKERRCLGFARAFDAPVMQIAGWYCSAGQEVVDRAALGCALDRLDILSAGGDASLDDVFANAELRRSFCGERNPIIAATPERDEATAALQRAKLRGHLSAR